MVGKDCATIVGASRLSSVYGMKGADDDRLCPDRETSLCGLCSSHAALTNDVRWWRLPELPGGLVGEGKGHGRSRRGRHVGLRASTWTMNTGRAASTN